MGGIGGGVWGGGEGGVVIAEWGRVEWEWGGGWREEGGGGSGGTE